MTDVNFRLLESLESFLDKVEVVQDVNDTNNRTVFALKTFALQIQELNPQEYQGQTFSVDLGSVEEAMKLEQRIGEGDLRTSETVMEAVTNATASIQLPENLLESCNNTNMTLVVTPQRLSYSVFVLDVLFQNLNQTHLKIGSIIVAARLKCADNATLNVIIQSTFQVSKGIEVKDSDHFHFFFFGGGGLLSEIPCM